MLHSEAKRILGSDPEVGEAKAMKLGMVEAVKQGASSIIMEGDSKGVVYAITHFPRRVNWRIHTIVGEIHGWLTQVNEWKYQHTRRGANNAAHCLARWAASEASSVGSPFVFEHSLDLN